MGLLPHYRRKGIGAELMRECLRHAKKRGISLISADKDILSLRSRFSWIKAV